LRRRHPLPQVGSGAGLGFNVNVAWNGSGVRDADMLAAFRHVIVPIASEFRPDLVIVSAGFDAVEGDPLGGCRVSPAAFGHFTALLAALAPSVLLLEGGYNLTATAAATEACVRVLLGEAPAPLPGGLAAGGPATATAPPPASASADPWVSAGLDGVSDSALESLRLALRVQGQYWRSAREAGAVVEAAVEEQRQRQLARLQAAQAQAAQQAQAQPHEHWGWHVQMAPSPSPPPLLPQAQAQAQGHAAVHAEPHQHQPPSSAPYAQHGGVLHEHEEREQAACLELLQGAGRGDPHGTRFRLDVSMSGVMEVEGEGEGDEEQEQPPGYHHAGESDDVQMG
ncbi:Histone deacetylase 6, partial [Tetrabaena socialis]